MPEAVTHSFDLTALLTGRFYCSACAARVCDEVRAFDGVSAAECDLEAGSLAVTYDPSVIGRKELEAVVGRLALEAEGRVLHAAYRVIGLD